MKQKMRRDVSAFTRVELIVVVVIFGLLAALLVPDLARRARARARTTCVNNLKEIGMAYRIWASELPKFPAQMQTIFGGWSDFLTNADQGGICWTNYAIITNELGLDTRLVVCPSDQRRPATNFTTDFKDNSHLSYFVGVGAYDVWPQAILGGDRNLGPGKVPDTNYGYSPTNGIGNDVAVPISGPVSWSLKMHSAGNAAGAGNILLGDSSAQYCNSATFRSNWLINAESPTLWPAGHVPSSPSIRLVFP